MTVSGVVRTLLALIVLVLAGFGLADVLTKGSLAKNLFQETPVGASEQQYALTGLLLDLLNRARQGNGEAAYAVAIYYSREIDDPVAAMAWMERAAVRGYPAGQMAFARRLSDPNSEVGPNLAAAFDWTRRAAMGGETDAMETLIELLIAGVGTTKDEEEAYAWILTTLLVSEGRKACVSTTSGMSRSELVEKKNALRLRLTARQIATAEVRSRSTLEAMGAAGTNCED